MLHQLLFCIIDDQGQMRKYWNYVVLK